MQIHASSTAALVFYYCETHSKKEKRIVSGRPFFSPLLALLLRPNYTSEPHATGGVVHIVGPLPGAHQWKPAPQLSFYWLTRWIYAAATNSLERLRINNQPREWSDQPTVTSPFYVQYVHENEQNVIQLCIVKNLLLSVDFTSYYHWFVIHSHPVVS